MWCGAFWGPGGVQRGPGRPGLHNGSMFGRNGAIWIRFDAFLFCYPVSTNNIMLLCSKCTCHAWSRDTILVSSHDTGLPKVRSKPQSTKSSNLPSILNFSNIFPSSPRSLRAPGLLASDGLGGMCKA